MAKTKNIKEEAVGAFIFLSIGLEVVRGYTIWNL